MKVLESIEEITEVRAVTVTLGFEFVNGELKNPEDQEMYELVKPVGDEIITESDEDSANENLEDIRLDIETVA